MTEERPTLPDGWLGAENWPEWQAFLVRCVTVPAMPAGPDSGVIGYRSYYEHRYSFGWAYRYDGQCPHHQGGYRKDGQVA